MPAQRTVTWRRLARELHEARRAGVPVAPLTSRTPDLDLEAAYQIQWEGITLRLAEGESIVGGKLGFTSQAMRSAMGVDTPNYGWLTGSMLVHDRTVELRRMIHPKAEPEIGFLLGSDLPSDCTAADVLEATVVLFPCLEIVDSRYHDFRFEALDNIADNSSAGGLVVGDAATSPRGIELARVGVVLRVDGDVVETAAGGAVLDHPAKAVAWMARHARIRGLVAGDIVISGGLTRPVDLCPGMNLSVEIDRIGKARFRVD